MPGLQEEKAAQGIAFPATIAPGQRPHLGRNMRFKREGRAFARPSRVFGYTKTGPGCVVWLSTSLKGAYRVEFISECRSAYQLCVSLAFWLKERFLGDAWRRSLALNDFSWCLEGLRPRLLSPHLARFMGLASVLSTRVLQDGGAMLSEIKERGSYGFRSVRRFGSR